MCTTRIPMSMRRWTWQPWWSGGTWPCVSHQPPHPGLSILHFPDHVLSCHSASDDRIFPTFKGKHFLYSPYFIMNTVFKNMLR